MWQLLSVLLACLLLFFILRYLGLKRELGRLADAMLIIHGNRTNRQLTIQSGQAELARLAACINTLYEDIEMQRTGYHTAMEEMREGISNISHDLRTPLTSILGYLKLLRDGVNTQEEQQRYLEVVHRKANGLHGLVQDLFALVRLENDAYPMEHETLDAVALLGEELAALYPSFEAIGLPEVSLPETSAWINADHNAVTRVFGNLLQNMLKHGQQPMHITGALDRDEVYFHFSNAAPGLSPQDEDRLFQRFFTGDRMRSGKNTGLGLSIAQQFMVQTQGSIEALLEAGMLTITLRWPTVGRPVL